MTIEVDNIRYHIQTRGAGKPLVCLHGFSEDLGTWDGLSVPGHQLVLVDFIGHGKSDKPLHRKWYRLNGMLTHLRQLFGKLGLSKVRMLGYSMGGRVALAYALANPADVEALVLESASYGVCDVEGRRLRRKEDGELALGILEKGVDWFSEHWGDLPIFETQRSLPEEARQRIEERRRNNAPHGLANTLFSSGQGVFPCLKGKIADLGVPTLYMSGEKDEKYRRMGEELVRLNPLIRAVSVPGCGHNTHLENPQAFSGLVAEFLRGNGAGA